MNRTIDRDPNDRRDLEDCNDDAKDVICSCKAMISMSLKSVRSSWSRATPARSQCLAR